MNSIAIPVIIIFAVVLGAVVWAYKKHKNIVHKQEVAKKVEEISERVEGIIEEVSSVIEDTAEDVSEKVEDIVEDVSEKVEDIVEDVSEKVEDIVEDIKDKKKVPNFRGMKKKDLLIYGQNHGIDVRANMKKVDIIKILEQNS